MSDDRPDEEARENFTYFANEYAQALQAYKAIEDQSTTLMLLGVGEDLRTFIDQFVEMAELEKCAGFVERLIAHCVKG